MSVTSVPAAGAAPTAFSSPFHPAAGSLDEATTRSQSFLLSEQKPEGYWVGELIVDSTLVSDMVVFHHWWGRVDPEWQRKAVNHILERQLADGGWNIYPNGPAEVNATVKAYMALKMAGFPATEPRMLKARAMACALGGVPRHDHFCQSSPVSSHGCAARSRRAGAFCGPSLSAA